jgi:hypothetical protein
MEKIGGYLLNDLRVVSKEVGQRGVVKCLKNKSPSSPVLSNCFFWHFFLREKARVQLAVCEKG